MLAKALTSVSSANSVASVSPRSASSVLGTRGVHHDMGLSDANVVSNVITGGLRHAAVGSLSVTSRLSPANLYAN